MRRRRRSTKRFSGEVACLLQAHGQEYQVTRNHGYEEGKNSNSLRAVENFARSVNLLITS